MPLQMRYFLETLGPTMGGLSHSCCQWYKNDKCCRRKKCFSLIHLLSSTGHLTLTPAIQWDAMGYCEQDAPISRVNALPSPSALMVYWETVLLFPENCSTPKLTSFNVHWGVLNLIRVVEIYLRFFLILYFWLRLGLQINSKLDKQTE